jgi:predicted acylesterase/phospholipase RssA
MVSANDVKYLAFQGGGGKGATYIGALTAFAEVGIFNQTSNSSLTYPYTRTDWTLNTNQIVGIAGASAGAITATLVACGFTLREIFDFIMGRSKNAGPMDFFDSATPRKIPQVTSQTTTTADESCMTLDMPSALGDEDLDAITNGLLLRLANPVSGALLTYVAIPAAVKKGILPKSLGDQIKKSTVDYTKNLIIDYGLFCGATARKTFDQMIGNKVAAKTNGPAKFGITFDQFNSIFGVDLVLIGTNLVNGASIYFSGSAHEKFYPNQTTGSFKVVDALRISMSFPGAFKPITIGSNQVSDKRLAGTWVDGGVLNNLPIHAFDDPSTSAFNSGMLGVSLGGKVSNSFSNILAFLWAINTSMQGMASLGQIRNPQEAAQTVPLDPGSLSLLDFGPTLSTLSPVINDANDKVLQFLKARPSRSVINTITSSGPGN